MVTLLSGKLARLHGLQVHWPSRVCAAFPWSEDLSRLTSQTGSISNMVEHGTHRDTRKGLC